MEIIENFRVVLDFQVSLNQETGEITTNCIKKSIDKTNFKSEEPKKRTKVKKEETNVPTLNLEDNKYSLNTAAIELIGVEYGCKLDIKYQKIGKDIVPVIADDEVWGTHSGNRLTKTFTVACRGSKHDELAKYGNSFTIVQHPDTVGLFILESSKIETKDPEIEDIPALEEELSIPIDEDLQSLIDSTDAQIKEVPASIFTL